MKRVHLFKEPNLVAKYNAFPYQREAFEAVKDLNRPLSSRQMKKEKLRHEGLVPVSKGSQAL